MRADKALGPEHRWKPSPPLPSPARPPAHLLHQQALELALAILHALAVSAVHHPDEAIRALKVVSPVGAQGFLAAHIPYVQLESAQGRDGRQVSLTDPLPSLPALLWAACPPAGTPLTLGVPGS